MGLTTPAPCSHCPAGYPSPGDWADQMAVYGAITQSFSCAGRGSAGLWQGDNEDPFAVPARGAPRPARGGGGRDWQSAVRLEAQLPLPRARPVPPAPGDRRTHVRSVGTFWAPGHLLRRARTWVLSGHPLPLLVTRDPSAALLLVRKQFPGKRFCYVCAVIQSPSRGLLLHNKTGSLGINTEM